MSTDQIRVPESEKPVLSTSVTEPASCCSTERQTTCCDSSEKSACCGNEATAGGGCGCQ